MARYHSKIRTYNQAIDALTSVFERMKSGQVSENDVGLVRFMPALLEYLEHQPKRDNDRFELPELNLDEMESEA